MLFYFHPGDLSLGDTLLLFFLLIGIPIAVIFLFSLFIKEIFKFRQNEKYKENNKDLSVIEDENEMNKDKYSADLK